MIDSPRVFGLDNLAKTIPTITDWNKTPKILWKHKRKMASGHSVVGDLVPYPVVYWVSKENKNEDTKSCISVTHGSLK